MCMKMVEFAHELREPTPAYKLVLERSFGLGLELPYFTAGGRRRKQDTAGVLERMLGWDVQPAPVKLGQWMEAMPRVVNTQEDLPPFTWTGAYVSGFHTFARFVGARTWMNDAAKEPVKGRWRVARCLVRGLAYWGVQSRTLGLDVNTGFFQKKHYGWTAQEMSIESLVDPREYAAEELGDCFADDAPDGIGSTIAKGKVIA